MNFCAWYPILPIAWRFSTRSVSPGTVPVPKRSDNSRSLSTEVCDFQERPPESLGTVPKLSGNSQGCKPLAIEQIWREALELRPAQKEKKGGRGFAPTAPILLTPAEVVMLEGYRSNALAGGGEDRVGHCRRGRRQAGLANAAPLVAAAEGKVGLHLGHLTQFQ